MRDRLSYAAIGLVLGLLLAIVLWWVFGAGFGRHHGSLGSRSELLPWLKYIGGGGALAGFVLKERVGDLVGGSIHAVYDTQTQSSADVEVPRWLFALVLVAVVVGVWYFYS